MYDVEITEGFDGRTVEKLGTCRSEAKACKMVQGWAKAHPEHGPSNSYWRFVSSADVTVIDYGSHTHFGKIVYRNRVPQTAVKQEGATE